MPAFSFKYTTNASAGGTPKAFPIESWNQGTPRYPHHFAFPKGSLQRVSLKIPLAHIPIPYQTQFPKDSCRYNALSFPTTIQSISVDSQSCTTLLELLLWIIPVLIRFLLLCCFGIFCFLYTLQTHSLPFPGVSAGWSNTCICSFFNPSRSERAAQPSQKPKKDNIWQQDRPPAAPVAVQADQYLAGAACCPGDNEQGWTDGRWIWEEDLETLLTLCASVAGRVDQMSTHWQ